MEEECFNDLTDDEKSLLGELTPGDLQQLTDLGVNRRQFLKQISIAGGGLLAFQLLGSNDVFASPLEENLMGEIAAVNLENSVTVSVKVNGTAKSVMVDSRMTLLDALRERLQLTGTKKGCDHGQCGACTVIVDGKRVLSCLTLAATCQAKSVTTIEGVSKNGTLHPIQAAFLKHDAFQCGYCTPGQICSAVALLEEAKKGEASYVTNNVRIKPGAVPLTDEEIRERMSGNICRCGAYPNIVAAISEVHTGKDVAQKWQFVQEDKSQAFDS